jgi:hypothetical protein
MDWNRQMKKEDWDIVKTTLVLTIFVLGFASLNRSGKLIKFE